MPGYRVGETSALGWQLEEMRYTLLLITISSQLETADE